MAISLFPLSHRGVPSPFLITPQTSEEATSGKATLIAAGDIAVILTGIATTAPERTDLITKFETLRDS